MTTHKNLMALCIAALFTLGLAACGSNGSDDPDTGMTGTPMPAEPTDGGTITWEQLSAGYTAMPGEGGVTYMLDLSTLPDDVDIHDVEGTHMFPAGAMETIAGINFMCAAGSTGCTVEIDHDGHITIMGGNIMTAAVMPPAPPPRAMVVIPDAMYLDDENMPMAGMISIAAGDSHTSRGVMFECPAGGDACEVEVMANGMVYSTGGQATATLTDSAVTQVAQAKKDAADKAAAAALEQRDRVIGKDRALEAAANLADGTTAGTLDENDISISRGPGAMASVEVDDPAGYVPSTDPILPNSGWAGRRFVRDLVDGSAKQHLFVYTDIDAPARIQFYDFDGDMDTPQLYGGSVAADGTVTTTEGDEVPYTSATTIPPLTLTGGDVDATNFSADVADLTRFPAPLPVEEGSHTQEYDLNDDGSGDGTDDRVSIPGNYNGAGGRYLCTPAADGCSVEVAPTGVYTIVGTWTFVPELNATAFQPDANFISFGWWLEEPTDPTGAYTFRYYADGTPYGRPAAVTNLAAGSVTYNGRAAGKYVMQEIDDTGVTGGMTGQFAAAASLRATFSGTGAGGFLSGTISGFQTDNAGVDVSGWSVMLNRQSLTDTADTSLTSAGTNNDPTDSGFDGATAMMGDQEAHGTWSSQFFGQPDTDDAYPLGVGGVFEADNEAASIAGAFGANR